MPSLFELMPYIIFMFFVIMVAIGVFLKCDFKKIEECQESQYKDNINDIKSVLILCILLIATIILWGNI